MMRLQEPPLEAIKGGLPPLIHTHHFGAEEEKGGLHLLELLSRVG
jgi:hypothetical protein